MGLFMNGLNHLKRSSKLRRNYTAQGPLTVLSEDEQFFKETGLIILYFYTRSYLYLFILIK